MALYIKDYGCSTSFNGTGKLVTDIGSATDDKGSSVTVQADGKIVVAGTSTSGGLNDFAVVRYTADGGLDTGFGAGGKLVTNIGGSSDAGRSVTVQADGKIVVAGYTYSGGSTDFAVVRYTANGTLDTSFNGTGKLLTGFGSFGTDYGRSVTVQADGKIVVAGTSDSAGPPDFAVVRYNANGSLDTSFNGTGKLVTNIDGVSNDQGYSVTVQADGKIVVAGDSNSNANRGGPNDFAVVRYHANGTLDTGFGTGGTLLTDIDSSSWDEGKSVTVQPDGKIVVAGYSTSGGSNNFAVVRYTANGSLDTSFNGTGKRVTDIGSATDDKGYSVTVQSDGKIVVVGTSDSNFAVVRYNVDGSLDTGFGVGPAIDTLGAAVAYTENASAIALDASVAVFDAELAALNGGLGNYSGASVTLARSGGSAVEDVFSALGNLAFTNGDAVLSGTTVGTVTNTGGTLTITFNANATQALVNQTLSSIGYANTSDAPPASVQVDWSFSDGNTGSQGSGGALAAAGSTTVDITAVNDVPVAVADSIIVAEGGVATTLVGGATSLLANDSDAENNPLTAVLVTGPAHGSLTVNANGTFTYTRTGGGTAADSFTYKANDGAAQSNTATVNITVTPADTAPTITNLAGDSVAWAGVGNTVRLDAGSNALLADAELGALNSGNGNWNGASLTVQRAGTAISADVLGFDTAGAAFTVSGTSANLQSGGQTFATYTHTGGVLTISFTSSGTAATTALVNNVAQHITYGNNTPAGDATLRFTLNDGAASTTADVAVTSDVIYVTNATDTDTIDPSNGVSLSEAIAIAAADATGSQTIVLAASLAGQTITLAGNVAINENLTLDLSAAPGVTVTGSTLNLGTGTTLTVVHGAGTGATLASALGGTGTLDKSGTGTLTLSGANTYTGSTGVTGGTLLVNGALATSVVNVAAGATLGGSGSITGNVSVASGGTLSPDSGTGTGVLTINGNLGMATGSTLAAQINGTTAGTGYDQVLVNGTANVTGATLAVTHGYTPAQGDSYTLIVNDLADAVTGAFTGLAEGGTQTASGNGTVLTASYVGGTGNDFTLTAPVNAAPVATPSGGSTAFAEGANVTSTPVVIDSGITVADPDNTTLASATVAITGNFQSSEDLLAFTNDLANMGNVIASYNSATGVLTLTSAGATATLAQWQAALRAVTYSNSSDTPNTPSRTISFGVDDGTASSSAATKTVTVAAANDAPVAVADSITVAEGGTATTLANSATSVLANDTDAEGSTLTATLVTGPAHGTLTLSANGTFIYTHDGSETTTDSFSYKPHDGTVDGNTVSVAITVTPVNDAPTITGLPGAPQAVTAGVAAALADFAVSDADGAGVPLHVTLAATNGTLNGLTDADTTTAGLQLSGTAAAINAAIAGATFTASAAGVASIGISVSDGTAPAVTGTYQLSAAAPPPPPPPEDDDGVSAEEEDSVPGVPSRPGGPVVAGDGNGDGIKDSEQPQVTSLNLRQTDRVSNQPDASPTPVTLVVGSHDGKVSPSAGNAKITSIGQKDAPADLPEGFSAPLGLLGFTATVDTKGDTGSFSFYLDGALDIDGYYKQDASGTWVNLASAANGGRVVTEHGKTRLDFVIQDGGQFDLDGKADGVITDPGAPGKMALVPPPVDSDHDQFPDALEAAHGLTVGVKDNDVFGNPKLYAMQLYRDTLFREAEGAGLTYWQEVLGSGAQSRAQVANAFLNSTEFQTHAGALARLYFAAFERIPDEAGMTHWMEQMLNQGQSLEQVAQGFADSSEFQRQYGALDNAGFLDTLYQNVLGRLPDAPGKAYWLGQLAGGTTRGEALAGFAQSSEYQELMREEVSVTLFYVGLLGRTPDQSGYEHWLHVLNNQGDVLGAIDAFVQSQEYHDRFLPSDGGPAGLVGLAPMPVPDALG